MSTSSTNIADVDKYGLGTSSFNNQDNTCWLAAASNLLAMAGFRDKDEAESADVETRAKGIYDYLIGWNGGTIAEDGTSVSGTLGGGWTDNALTHWLNSDRNQQTKDVTVTVIGNKSGRPHSDPALMTDIEDFLSSGSFVGLSISWPNTSATNQFPSTNGGHAFTCVEVDLGSNDVICTDSDRNTSTSPTDTYRYASTDYQSATLTDRSGFALTNYSPTNAPFLKHIVVLTKNSVETAFTRIPTRVVMLREIALPTDEPIVEIRVLPPSPLPLPPYKYWFFGPKGELIGEGGSVDPLTGSIVTIPSDATRIRIQLIGRFDPANVPLVQFGEVKVLKSNSVSAYPAVSARIHFTKDPAGSVDAPPGYQTRGGYLRARATMKDSDVLYVERSYAYDEFPTNVQLQINSSPPPIDATLQDVAGTMRPKVPNPSVSFAGLLKTAWPSNAESLVFGTTYTKEPIVNDLIENVGIRLPYRKERPRWLAILIVLLVVGAIYLLRRFRR